MKRTLRRPSAETLESRALLAAAYHLTFDDEFNSSNSAHWRTSDFWGMRNNPGDYQDMRGAAVRVHLKGKTAAIIGWNPTK